MSISCFAPFTLLQNIYFHIFSLHVGRQYENMGVIKICMYVIVLVRNLYKCFICDLFLSHGIDLNAGAFIIK
jgi:hypothetical protein